MSRIGKIARLPKAIREELNRRLEDGEQQTHLVEWLNGHAEVQAVLMADFAGKPINEPNLTAWKQGGYVDWLRQQEALDVGERIVEETSELGVLAQGQLMADRVAMMAALAIGEQLMAARRMEDGAEKRRTILKLVRGLVRLRKSDREQERAVRDEEAEQRRRDYHQDWVERMRKPKAPFADLSDAELIRRMEEMRALGEIAPRADATGWEGDDEDYDEDARSTSSGQTQRLEDGERRTEDGGQGNARSADLGQTQRLEAAVGRHAVFEVRGGEAHGIHRTHGKVGNHEYAGGAQARTPRRSGQDGKAGNHEAHEIHEKESPESDSSDRGSIRYCRIEGI